jgi:transcriptional regulator with XRE-family HTH domain
MSDIRRAFAKRLKFLRLTHQMTQEELSERTGIPQMNISNWERERNDPSWPYVYALAEAFGVSTDQFGIEPDNMPIETEMRGRPRKETQR